MTEGPTPVDGHDDTPAWARTLDGELVRSALRQPYVAFTDPLRARRNFARATRLSNKLRARPDQPDVVVEDLAVRVPDDGRELKVRRYRRRGAALPAPALAYFHGGAFVAGDLETEHDRCLRLAAHAGCSVFAVDYRRAPEHPFPAPGEDCYAAVRWLHASAVEAGVDPRRIAVGGSSAGATLAAAVALMARDRGGPRLSLQMLLYPALDDRLDTRSMRTFPQTSSWTTGDSALMWRHYLGDHAGASACAHAVPARCEDFRGVAPAYVLVAEVDALRDEAIDYATRMLRDGVPVELHQIARTFHGFDAAMPEAALSARALAEQCAALDRALRVQR